jgi:23S rRNA pseudouridine2605 synthase
MKKTNNFEKFLPKKKNSAIKEEFRQIKRKEKQARAEAIEQRKAAKRLEKQQGAGGWTPPSGGKTRPDYGKPISARAGAKTPDRAPASRDTAKKAPSDSRVSADRKAPVKTTAKLMATGKPAGKPKALSIGKKTGAGATKPALTDQRKSGINQGTEKITLKKNEQRKKADEMPLNKYISHCGVCSRRDAAILIKEGKVKVNNELITEPGFKVTADDDVKLNNKKIYLAHNLVYILLNKPKDYITTAEDPQGRKTVLDLLKGATPERIFPVGRLDRNTTGVLLLTNDGELTQKLSHPSFEVRKMYEVKLDRPLSKVDFEKILKGITLEDGPVQIDALAYADMKDKSIIGIELHSGKNRIVRRIFEFLGYDVRNLDRVMFANLTKKNVERGKWRFLKDKEVRLLKFMNSSFIKKQKKSEA